MKILITGPGTFLCESKKEPEIGRTYLLEDAKEGTTAQRKTFFALAGEFWRTGMHSYDAADFNVFRGKIQARIGSGFSSYLYIDQDGKFGEVEKWEDVPERIRKSPDRNDIIRGKLKSLTDYTMKEYISLIDNLITEMIESGVNTPKFDEIMEGIDG